MLRDCLQVVQARADIWVGGASPGQSLELSHLEYESLSRCPWAQEVAALARSPHRPAMWG